jgi:hypothetical protein
MSDGLLIPRRFGVDQQDPFDIGHPAACLPSQAGGTNTWSSANRGAWYRLIAGGYDVNRLHYRVGVQSGNICWALYRSNGLRGRLNKPAALLWTSGSIACPAPAVGGQTLDMVTTVRPMKGDWLYFGADNTTVTLATCFSANIAGPTEGWAYYADDAFPAPDPAPALTAGSMRMYQHQFSLA